MKKMLIAVFICWICGMNVYADEGFKLNVIPAPSKDGATFKVTAPVGNSSVNVNVHTSVKHPATPVIKGGSVSASIPVGDSGVTVQPYIDKNSSSTSGGINVNLDFKP